MLSVGDKTRLCNAFLICHGCGKAIQPEKVESLYLEEMELFVIHANCIRKLPRNLAKSYVLSPLDSVIDLEMILTKMGQ